MRFAVVSYHLPHPDGTANGRQVFAAWDAARRAGHDVAVWCWGERPAGLDAPDWVMCRRFDDPGGLRRKPATIMRPRWGLAATGWRAPDDAVAWAEEPESYAAVASSRRRVVTVPHSAWLDAVALRRFPPSLVQSIRAERSAIRAADRAVTLSQRIARTSGVAHVVPVALAPPDEPVAPVSEPVALLLADWSWLPNRRALLALLRAWPQVRRAVPAARLLLVGRGDIPAVAGDGVEVRGEVPTTRDALAQAAVFAFPCPSTSGTKLKVLDALLHGVPVLTTPAGVEGLSLSPQAAVVTSQPGFADALIELLSDPSRRCRLAAAGRAAAIAGHSPQQAAQARIAVAESLL